MRGTATSSEVVAVEWQGLASMVTGVGFNGGKGRGRGEEKLCI